MFAQEIIKKNLKEFFGHEVFRQGQLQLVNAILNKQDVLGIMPTGGGKSICYQLPAVMMSGITIVISPLISLMKDQIHSLKGNGISAAFINSTLTESQIDIVINRALNNEYKIIYVAPERLLSQKFKAFCQDVQISLIAIDEAHCVSQWGQDFRPSYCTIPDFIDSFSVRPVVAAFTATATQTVQDDIKNLMKLQNPKIIVNSFDRANLFFEVRQSAKKFDELIKIIQTKKGQCGIVYCSTRKNVDDVAQKLKSSGFNAESYHAGLSDKDRHQNQDDFIYDKIDIMVATNAFGMGIDKSNVSYVVHYNMPKDIESYYQEAGRAGRDGSSADCILLYNGQDVMTNLFLIDNSEGRQYESKEQEELLKQQERRRLNIMKLYCNTNSCLRNYILDYFGEKTDKDCDNCGNCLQEKQEQDVTTLAQKILSCVVRLKESYGKVMIIDVLRGSAKSKLLQNGLDKLSVYNICKESENEIIEVFTYLLENGYLVQTDSQYPTIKLGERARDILYNNEKIVISKIINDRRQESTVTAKYKNQDSILNPKLFMRLKEVRKQLANNKGVPAFFIFSDKELIGISNKAPQNLNEFSKMSGVGEQKLKAYGEIFVKEINDFLSNSTTHSGVQFLKNSAQTKDYSKIDIQAITISEKELLISEIADNIYIELEKHEIKKISAIMLNQWLEEQSIIKKVDNGKEEKIKLPTDKGVELGIIVEERVSAQGKKYNVLYFSYKIQTLIIESLVEILNWRDSKK